MGNVLSATRYQREEYKMSDGDAQYTIALNKFQQQFDALMTTIPDIQKDIEKPRTPELPWRTYLQTLVEEFKCAATAYFETAKVVIDGVRKANQPVNVPYEFGQVLMKIANHTALLDDIAKQGPSESPETLLEALIWTAAAELSELPILIPRLQSQNSFIHFNYVRSIGIIGYTSPALARPPQDAAIFWHEVAGYSVARALDDGHLQIWATELKCKLQEKRCSAAGESRAFTYAWDWYWTSFMKSKLEQMRVKLVISRDGDASRLVVKDSAGIRRYFKFKEPDLAAATANHNSNVEDDISWQVAWLGEFIEDMYGLRSLGSVYFHTQASALLQRYPDLTIGDAKHPAPLLRLQVALNFLATQPGNDTDASAVIKVLEDLNNAFPGAIGCLQFNKGNADNSLPCNDLDNVDVAISGSPRGLTNKVKQEWLCCLRAAAKIISETVACIAASDKLFAPESPAKEITVVHKIKAAVQASAEEITEGGVQVYSQAQNTSPGSRLCKSLELLESGIRAQYWADVANNMKYRTSSEQVSAFAKEIEKLGDMCNAKGAMEALQRLHTIEFTRTDANGPDVGETILLPIQQPVRAAR
jgi:hypothetical protein